jgi:3-hydroxymyristoyl/3-hydroxydecanoyl-(acyl carrier protein) dehydratase
VSVLDRDALLAVLPHRPPFLMLDRVLALEPGRRILACKQVRADEPLGMDAARGVAVFPLELVIEAVGQAAMVLVTYGRPPDPARVPLFAGCDCTFFAGPVEVGRRLEVEATIEKALSVGALVAGRARVDGRLLATMTLRAGFGALPSAGRPA